MRLPILSLVMMAVAVAGCSDDLDTGNESSPGGRQPGTVVDVVLTDFQLQAPQAVDEGTITFRVRNEGDTEHSFRIAGEGIDEELREVVPPGEARELSVALKFGTYEVWCPIGDHRDRGMDATIQVLPVGQPTPVVYPSP